MLLLLLLLAGLVHGYIQQKSTLERVKPVSDRPCEELLHKVFATI